MTAPFKVVVEISGPAGSGKSQLATRLAELFAADGLRVVVLDCDDKPSAAGMRAELNLLQRAGRFAVISVYRDGVT